MTEPDNGTDGWGVERWSAGRKSEVVLRLLRGEAIAAVSREVVVPVHQLEEWRRVFLEGGKTACVPAACRTTSARSASCLSRMAQMILLQAYRLVRSSVGGGSASARAVTTTCFRGGRL
jgi:transposase-like protein